MNVICIRIQYMDTWTFVGILAGGVCFGSGLGWTWRAICTW